MSNKKIRLCLIYLIVALVIVVGIGYSYLNQDLSLQNNVTLTNYSAVPKPVCIKATTLHTETCSRTTSEGCRAKGYSYGATITYGHTNSAKLSNGQLTNGLSQGYALDCDVNGNGVVDTDTNGNSTERFYYVSDFYDTNLDTPAFNSDYATLIYYKNYGSSAVSYYSSKTNSQGPSALLSTLPATTSWTNKGIRLKNTTRNILTETGTVKKSSFAYTGRAARLLTTQEIDAATGSTSRTSTGYLNNVEFLMEDTNYSKSSGCSGGSCYYWLETPNSSDFRYVLYVSGSNRLVSNANANGSNGVRPAVDILKSDISLQ